MSNGLTQLSSRRPAPVLPGNGGRASMDEGNCLTGGDRHRLDLPEMAAASGRPARMALRRRVRFSPASERLFQGSGS